MSVKSHRSARIAVFAVALCSLVGFAASASLATNATVVNLAACAFGDGATTVPSGVPIVIHAPGFAQGNYGLTTDFLLKQHTTLTVTGAANFAADLSGDWGAPQQLDRKLWVTRLPDTSLGISLAPGSSIVATFDITFSHPLLVAYPPVGPSGDNGPFLTREDGPLSCTITGARS